MKRLCLYGCLVSIATTPKLWAAADDQAVADALTQVRAAVGIGESNAPAFTMRGSARKFELTMTYRLTCDGHGRFRSIFDGPIASEQGFDGTTAWIRDFSTATRALELNESEEARLSGWIRSGYWLCREAPVEISIRDKASGDASEVLLTVAVRGGMSRGTLAIDRQTWLPRRLEFATEGDLETMSLEDYRPVAGVMLPFHVVTTQVAGVPTAITIDQALVHNNLEQSDFTFHPQLPVNARFDANAAPALEVKRARSGHLLVRPRLAGNDVGWFIFDSGAGIMCVDSELAERLHLPRFGVTQVKGAGGSTHSSFTRIASLQLGPLCLTDCLAVELNLRPIGMALGEPVAGIVGYQAFQASVVELDMDRATVSLYDPTAYQLTPQGRWAPLFVLSNHPCCTARFEGDREAVFRLDSGGAGTVLFHTQAVDRLKLLDGRKTTASVLGGVGGLIVSRRGTLDWFELGGYRFEKPTADFSRSNKGAAQGIVIVGTIGHELLKRFQIVLDYHQRRVAFLDRTH